MDIQLIKYIQNTRKSNFQREICTLTGRSLNQTLCITEGRLEWNSFRKMSPLETNPVRLDCFNRVRSKI